MKVIFQKTKTKKKRTDRKFLNGSVIIFLGIFIYLLLNNKNYLKLLFK